MSDLTPQKDKFSLEVASGKTYAESYRIAYPKSVKWKDESVWCESSKLMSDPNVLQRVKELQEKTAKRNEVTLDEVLKELALWIRLDPIEFVDDNDCAKKMSELPKEVRKCLASPIEVLELFSGRGENRVKTGELKTIRFIDKQAVADKFMKFFGAYITNLKLDVEDLNHIRDLLGEIKK